MSNAICKHQSKSCETLYWAFSLKGEVGWNTAGMDGFGGWMPPWQQGVEGNGGSVSGTGRVGRHNREQSRETKKSALLLGSWEENDRRRETKPCFKEEKREEASDRWQFCVCTQQPALAYQYTTCHSITSSGASQLAHCTLTTASVSPPCSACHPSGPTSWCVTDRHGQLGWTQHTRGRPPSVGAEERDTERERERGAVEEDIKKNNLWVMRHRFQVLNKKGKQIE